MAELIDEKKKDFSIKINKLNKKKEELEVELKNEEFYNNVTQFDLLLNNDISESEMLTIEEVVLANYEEITRKES